MFNPKNILIATDLTDTSVAALREGIDIAREYHSTVHLLHVIHDIRQCAVDYCLSESEILSEKSKLREEAERTMEAQVNQTVHLANIPLVREIRFGNPVDEIIRYEEEKKIDLVITAPQAKRGWRNAHHLLNNLVNRSSRETMVVR